MPSTIVVALRKAVVAGLEDLFPGPPEDDVLVTYAWQPEAKDRYQVFTMRPRGEHSPAALKSGRNFREEDARFQVVVHVEEVGGSQEEADEKAIVFGQVVEEFLADHKGTELEVDGLKWLVVESWEMTGGPTDRSSVAQLIYTVHFNARLT